MGSQFFCSDPFPLPSSFKTNSPWLPLTPPLVLQLDAPCSYLVWPLVDSSLQDSNLSCLLLSLFWRQGHQLIAGLSMRARPPAGGLLVILQCLQEETSLFFTCLETLLKSLNNCRTHRLRMTWYNISSKCKLWSLRFSSATFKSSKDWQLIVRWC